MRWLEWGSCKWCRPVKTYSIFSAFHSLFWICRFLCRLMKLTSFITKICGDGHDGRPRMMRVSSSSDEPVKPSRQAGMDRAGVGRGLTALGLHGVPGRCRQQKIAKVTKSMRLRLTRGTLGLLDVLTTWGQYGSFGSEIGARGTVAYERVWSGNSWLVGLRLLGWLAAF